MQIIIKVERIAYKRKFGVIGIVNNFEIKSHKTLIEELLKTRKILEEKLNIEINNYKQNEGSHNDRN